MRDDKKRFKSTNTYFKIISIFLIITMMIAVASFQYYKSLSRTLEEETKTYLEEISNRIGGSVSRIINDNFVMLSIMAASLESKDMGREDAMELLTNQNEHLNFNDIMLIDSEGKGHSLAGNDVFIIFDDDIRKSILGGEKFISTTQIINNQEYVVFSVPLKDVTVGDKKRVAIVGTYRATAFNQVLEMDSFNEQAYSQIVTNDGIMITKPTSKYTINTGYNVFSTIAKSTFDQGSSMEKVKNDIKNNYQGQIGFKLDGDYRRYMVYTPINAENWYLVTFVPERAVNERSDALLKSTLVVCGIITITFAALIASLYLMFKNSKRKLEEMVYVDEITKGNTIQKFYNDAKMFIENHPKINYVILYTNIEKFKVFNDTMGRENGDLLLKTFNECISRDLSPYESIGRLGADNFCVIIECVDKEQLLNRFSSWHKNAEELVKEAQLKWNLPAAEMGVYFVEDRSLPLTQMIDRAKLSLRENTMYFDSKIHYAFYDDKVREALFREKYLEDRMEKALSEGEFKVFLQPKYIVATEKIGGAEALVRWFSPEEGMIYPNEFIALFEKNGFIMKLDMWVFEEVCKLIKSWMEKGYNPFKISVNCSRVQLRNKDFLDGYIKIIDQYQINRSYIEIEITETMVFENTDTLMEVIEDIRNAGFGCSMDDFGSGYSSLNLIQRIPVDTLKIDRIFFRKNEAGEAEKTEAVVKSIVSMAKSLKMETVAEGVEEREQVEMLERTGCDYIQGYVFAKPMSIEEFEQLAFGKRD